MNISLLPIKNGTVLKQAVIKATSRAWYGAELTNYYVAFSSRSSSSWSEYLWKDAGTLLPLELQHKIKAYELYNPV